MGVALSHFVGAVGDGTSQQTARLVARAPGAHQSIELRPRTEQHPRRPRLQLAPGRVVITDHRHRHGCRPPLPAASSGSAAVTDSAAWGVSMRVTITPRRRSAVFTLSFRRCTVRQRCLCGYLTPPDAAIMPK